MRPSHPLAQPPMTPGTPGAPGRNSDDSYSYYSYMSGSPSRQDRKGNTFRNALAAGGAAFAVRQLFKSRRQKKGGEKGRRFTNATNRRRKNRTNEFGPSIHRRWRDTSQKIRSRPGRKSVRLRHVEYTGWQYSGRSARERQAPQQQVRSPTGTGSGLWAMTPSLHRLDQLYQHHMMFLLSHQSTRVELIPRAAKSTQHTLAIKGIAIIYETRLQQAWVEPHWAPWQQTPEGERATRTLTQWSPHQLV